MIVVVGLVAIVVLAALVVMVALFREFHHCMYVADV